MNPNNQMLALRDPAHAAMLGAIRGADFGVDYRFQGDFGADLLPTAANMQQALAEKTATRMRQSLLDPNGDSTAKIQRYTFAVNQALVLGTASVINMTGKPQTQFRPQRITANPPGRSEGFATFSFMQVANVGILVGGTVDSSDFCNDGADQHLDVPTLGPQNEVNIAGAYTGYVPPGRSIGTAYTFATSFKGPATMAGG